MKKKIVESVTKAQEAKLSYEQIFSDPSLPVGKNEFLFFMKPEILLPITGLQLEKITDLVLHKIEEFGLRIHNVTTLAAQYLEEHNIIAQHYGVINKIAQNAVANMSQSAKEKFKALFGKEVTEVKTIGGIEFLAQNPHFDAYSSDFLWQNVKSEKLAGGTYCEVIRIDDETIYLINGFHPRQLKQFTEKGRSIVVMTLSGDLDWSTARQNFIGATNPQKANEGSLRREFLNRKAELGLPEVSQGVNGVHLSAGPVEALVELRRYGSNFADVAAIKKFTDFSLGKVLEKEFGAAALEKITANPTLDVAGKQISVFDLTEEKNAAEVVAILKPYFTK